MPTNPIDKPLIDGLKPDLQNKDFPGVPLSVSEAFIFVLFLASSIKLPVYGLQF